MSLMKKLFSVDGRVKLDVTSADNIKKQINKKIGLTVRVLRSGRHMTQEKFASMLPMDQSELSRKETGDRPFTMIELLKCCAILDVKPSYFFSVCERDIIE